MTSFKRDKIDELLAALDKGRRLSKRQKDLADILGLVEVNNHLISLVPETLKRNWLFNGDFIVFPI